MMMASSPAPLCRGLSVPEPGSTTTTTTPRRAFFERTAAAASLTLLAGSTLLAAGPAFAATGEGSGSLDFRTSASGIQWADARVGTGAPLRSGASATIDYAMSTTGARYGTKIYSTQQPRSESSIDGAAGRSPYRWTLGDGSTIAGIEEAVLGDASGSLPPMRPGGIRRLVIPQSMAYAALAEDSRGRCVADGKPGPIPPPSTAFEEYQRFKNIYCNPERQYQPDLVMDVKLYGAR
mmetsp:Transcript_19369/g.45048  ORF Transcript_19369/g.45048 Transcript_19369/m.45048 type:complete len:236 (+) Transcript_19369:301-1008(+)